MRNKGLKREQALARAHQGLSSIGQPIQPYFPSPSSPLLCPCPRSLLACMILEAGEPECQGLCVCVCVYRSVRDSVCVCVCWGLGRAGNISPYLGPPFTGCCGPQRINGAEATHFLWRQAAPHSPPLLAALISGSSASPIRRRLLGPSAHLPQPPISPFFASWRLESLAGLGS